MHVISVSSNPEFVTQAISYFQGKWASPESLKVYEDCILHSLNTKSPLPQWYLLLKEDKIIGCAGLITNDFISRMDLYPWGETSRIYEAHLEEKTTDNPLTSINRD